MIYKDTIRKKRQEKVHDVVLLCQLPPPVHGLSVVSQRVSTILSADKRFHVQNLAIGSASNLDDIGKKNPRKLCVFAWQAVRLLFWRTMRPRVDAAYLTFTPWAHTAVRDGILAGLARWIARRALIHLHTEGLDQMIKGRSLRERCLRRLIRGSELIAITEEAAVVARGSGLFSRVHLLPNMTEDPGVPNKAYGQVLHCGYLGNFDPRKGILEFVDVIAALNARGLSVTGEIVGGPSRLLRLDALNAHVHARGADDQIKVRGFVSEEEKSRFLMDLDVLIYPSRHDHAPLVLLEALANGVIPITLDTGGIRSLLAPHFSSHVIAAESNFTDAVEALLRGYLARPERLAFRSSKARALYQRRFSPNVFQARVRAIFAETDTEESLVAVPPYRVRSARQGSVAGAAVGSAARSGTRPDDHTHKAFSK